MIVGGHQGPRSAPWAALPGPRDFPPARLNAVGAGRRARPARLSYVGTGSTREPRPGPPAAATRRGPQPCPDTGHRHHRQPRPPQEPRKRPAQNPDPASKPAPLDNALLRWCAQIGAGARICAHDDDGRTGDGHGRARRPRSARYPSACRSHSDCRCPCDERGKWQGIYVITAPGEGLPRPQRPLWPRTIPWPVSWPVTGEVSLWRHNQRQRGSLAAWQSSSSGC